MFIESIILHNYRAYRGHNKTSFKPDTKNIFLVAGNNGFGKTTFLTSLVWCLYGKLMADVDEKSLEETSTMLKDIRIMLVRAYIRSLQMLLTHMKLV